MALSGMIIVPISAVPAQRFQCVLNGQNCTISIKKRGEYCYFSLMSNGVSVAENTICLCGNNLVPYNNPYFVGTLLFIDTNGHDDVPTYDGLGVRYKLIYIPSRFDL